MLAGLRCAAEMPHVAFGVADIRSDGLQFCLCALQPGDQTVKTGL